MKRSEFNLLKQTPIESRQCLIHFSKARFPSSHTTCLTDINSNTYTKAVSLAAASNISRCQKRLHRNSELPLELLLQ